MIGPALAEHPAPIERPGIQPQQESERPVQDQKQPQAETQPLQPQRSEIQTTPAKESHPSEQRQQGGEEGTEFWPPLLGYRIKITDSLLVLFTAVLAAVTSGLWYATHRLWRAGEKQIGAAKTIADAALLSAQAAINLERPFVFVSDLELRRLVIPPQEDGIERGDVYAVTYVFTNYGRLPALVKQIGFGFSVGKEAPPVPEYRATHDFTTELVIVGGKPYRFDIPGAVAAVRPEEREAFAKGDIVAWFWGKIRFQDFFGGTGEIGFIAFHYPEIRAGEQLLREASFSLYGPAAYIYQRYTQSEGA